ncbi:hypothetical protein F4827_005279 [Paraburkholderia bannensis]|uniref:Uncharacterized protein n=1 Tax=Paraburkholderia bannensis TaxID=765414 RepID=A0A7W9U1P9_9BURK|nr:MULTISPECIES: hypothetical protein [Paraburkholderia]MBB3260376.1 hypothetical protein [Paraburkholderia sp. WP4_3_2]MBB6105412.1 hypothetical protein [Paraburkholderia bannensis]
MKKLSCMVLGLLVATLSGCTRNTPDTLEGAYGAMQNGKVEPVIKVEKKASGYVFDDYSNGGWRSGSDLAQPVTRDEFEKLIGSPVNGPFIGLKTRVALVAKVQPGFTAGKFTTSTGYLMVFMFGPIELSKL